MLKGSSFQSRGAAIANDLSPHFYYSKSGGENNNEMSCIFMN